MIWKKNEMMEKIVCLNLPYCSYYMLHKIKKKENKVGQKGSKSKKVNAFIFYIFTHFLSNLEILKFIGQVKITNLIFHPFYVLPTKLPNNTFSKKKHLPNNKVYRPGENHQPHFSSLPCSSNQITKQYFL